MCTCFTTPWCVVLPSQRKRHFPVTTVAWCYSKAHLLLPHYHLGRRMLFPASACVYDKVEKKRKKAVVTYIYCCIVLYVVFFLSALIILSPLENCMLAWFLCVCFAAVLAGAVGILLHSLPILSWMQNKQTKEHKNKNAVLQHLLLLTGLHVNRAVCDLRRGTPAAVQRHVKSQQGHSYMKGCSQHASSFLHSHSFSLCSFNLHLVVALCEFTLFIKPFYPAESSRQESLRSIVRFPQLCWGTEQHIHSICLKTCWYMMMIITDMLVQSECCALSIYVVY